MKTKENAWSEEEIYHELYKTILSRLPDQTKVDYCLRLMNQASNEKCFLPPPPYEKDPSILDLIIHSDKLYSLQLLKEVLQLNFATALLERKNPEGKTALEALEVMLEEYQKTANEKTTAHQSIYQEIKALFEVFAQQNLNKSTPPPPKRKRKEVATQSAQDDFSNLCSSLNKEAEYKTIFNILNNNEPFLQTLNDEQKTDLINIIRSKNFFSQPTNNLLNKIGRRESSKSYAISPSDWLLQGKGALSTQDFWRIYEGLDVEEMRRFLAQSAGGGSSHLLLSSLGNTPLRRLIDSALQSLEAAEENNSKKTIQCLAMMTCLLDFYKDEASSKLDRIIDQVTTVQHPASRELAGWILSQLVSSGGKNNLTVAQEKKLTTHQNSSSTSRFFNAPKLQPESTKVENWFKNWTMCIDGTLNDVKELTTEYSLTLVIAENQNQQSFIAFLHENLKLSDNSANQTPQLDSLLETLGQQCIAELNYLETETKEQMYSFYQKITSLADPDFITLLRNKGYTQAAHQWQEVLNLLHACYSTEPISTDETMQKTMSMQL